MKAEKDIGGSKASVVPDLGAILANGGKRPQRRRTVLALASVAVIVAGVGGYFVLQGSGPTYSYTTQPAGRGNLEVIVTATGSVQPTDQVDISSELSGTIRAVNVTYNSSVNAGDVLAELDTNKLQADLENSRAQLASARANLLKAETDVASTKTTFDRLTGLASRNITSQQELDVARYAHQGAVAAKAVSEASVLSAEASLRLAEVDLGKSKIVSPISGVILTRGAEPGQTVASSLNAPVLFTIAGDLKQMELQVAVDEADVGQVREGQVASFSVDAYPDRNFPAKIETVRFASETVNNVVTYKAVLTVDNDDLLLRPGMTATADVVVESVEDALLVPNAALRFSPPTTASRGSGTILTRLFRPPRMGRDRQSANQADSAQRSVWVLRNGAPERANVQTGPTDGQSTVIRSGELRQGDMLITDALARNG